ncbi:MAG: hypothetical protein HKN99_11730, partial [Winogradskyella sp.]|nr:hypothetical protein [Winogradskyella sp.]
MNYKIIYLICLGSILLGNSFKAKKNELKEPLKLVTADSIYMAGKSIILKFSGDTNSESNLYLSGSYGSVLLKPELKDNLLFFSVPQSFCKKSGIVNWDLINNDQKLNGRFFINPKPTVNTLE